MCLATHHNKEFGEVSDIIFGVCPVGHTILGLHDSYGGLFHLRMVMDLV